MNRKQIKELLKAHCTIENGRWVFKHVDIDAATLELEQAISAKPFVSGSLVLAEIIDMLNNAHEALAKSEISKDEYRPISLALIDLKERIGVLLSGNDR